MRTRFFLMMLVAILATGCTRVFVGVPSEPGGWYPSEGGFSQTCIIVNESNSTVLVWFDTQPWNVFELKPRAKSKKFELWPGKRVVWIEAWEEGAGFRGETKYYPPRKFLVYIDHTKGDENLDGEVLDRVIRIKNPRYRDRGGFL